jgi:hypothetical protein
VRFDPRPADLALALHLGLKHRPSCRQQNADFNAKQPARQFHHYFCHCDFYERLDHAVIDMIREDVRSGIKRDLG